MRKMQICIIFFGIILHFDNVEVIADGVLTDYRKFPFIVRLEREKEETDNETLFEYICTGTVLSPVWTVTAGQCTTKLSNARGVVVYSNKTSKNLHVPIHKVITHPNYYSISDTLKPRDKRKYPQVPQFWNDIGLVRHAKIHLKAYGQISALPTGSLLMKRCHLFGYGFTNASDQDIYGNVFSPPIDGLLRSFNFVVSKCTRVTAIVYPGICGTATYKNTDTAWYGDAGGPAICFSRVVAVTTAGLNSMDLVDYSSVGVFTPINSYIRWIYGHLNDSSSYEPEVKKEEVRSSFEEMPIERRLHHFQKDALYDKRNRQLLEDMYAYYDFFR